MSGGGGLHAKEIDCLVSRHLIGVRWLGVFARDELPDVTSEIRPWCLILNTDPKDQPGTHWLALYAPKAGFIELFDSFNFSPITYSLESLHILHLGFPLQSISTSVCGYYCIVYIYLRSRNKSINELIICFWIFQIATPTSNGIFIIFKTSFASSNRVTVLVNVVN